VEFRQDINGLRAIAVIAVVLFHFNNDWMPGGFAGVDVFFVISGFLMTSIILQKIEAGSFNLMQFYIARANRIIPALALLCLVLLAFGWFTLTPADYKTLGLHAASSVSFLSNLVYWQEAGYFDAASFDKWLLHTWSLSVEWQFYIVYPIMLVAMRKFMSYAQLKHWILIATALGFVGGITITTLFPDAAYYLLPTRAWEMMFGGIAYLYPISLQYKNKRVFEYTGLGLIAASYILASEKTAWPGYAALLPVIGTFLVLQAKRNDSSITGNVVFQRLGQWSYSIYLWHWPLVVATYYFSLSNGWLYLNILLSVVFGFLSYQYVERLKFKTNDISFKSLLGNKPLYVAAIAGFAGSLIYINDGAKDRLSLSPKMAAIDKELIIPLRSNGYCFYSFNDGAEVPDKNIGTNCLLGSGQSQASTLLFGDSFAGHNEPFWDQILKANNKTARSVATNWCFPSLGKNFSGSTTHLSYEQCLLNRKYLKNNMHKYKNVILAGSWGDILELDMLADVANVVETAADLNINVFVMSAPTRYVKSPLQEFYKSQYFGTSFDINNVKEADQMTQQANLWLEKLASQFSNVHFLNRAMLFPKSNTLFENSIEIPYSLDGKHLSILGAKHSAQYFRDSKYYDRLMSNFDKG